MFAHSKDFFSKEFIEECHQSLLEQKTKLMNRSRSNHEELRRHSTERGGDETDLAVKSSMESGIVHNQHRLRHQLLEIEVALSKIAEGTYGICEETEEPIEVKRLQAIPWTRFSIEGAEIRESVQKQYHAG